MKTCVFLILLTIFFPGGCSVYDFDLKTAEEPIDFGNDLKLEADLNSEIQQGLMNIDRGTVNTKEFEEPQESPEATVMTRSNSQCPKKEEEEAPEIDNFVGSNLFDSNRKKCFSSEDIALMTARKDFEVLIPKDLPQCLLTDDMVCGLMQYFHFGNQIIQCMPDNLGKRLTEKAFYDTLGGYLKFYMLPVTKFSFYAGQVSIKTVQHVLALFQQCKNFLNTNGNGWKSPVKNVLHELNSVKIEPLKIQTTKDDTDEVKYCASLDLNSVNSDAEEDQMIVALPKLEAEDSDGYLGNIWLPFKRKRTYNLKSRKAAFIVVKFYETVTRCYKFQSLCMDAYNRKFKEWIVENVESHLGDDQLYPGLGAILRVYENLQRDKKSTDVVETVETHTDYEGPESEDGNDGEHILARKSERTNEYRVLDTEANRRSSGDDWFETNLTPEKCKPKVKIKPKPKLKPKCKPPISDQLGKASGPKKPLIDPDTLRMILKYLFYLMIILVIIMMCCICACIWKRRKKKCKTKQKPSKTGKGTPLCERFRNLRKKSHDQEIVIKPDSKSVLGAVLPTGKRAANSSSSSLVEHHLAKKFVPCKRPGNRSARSTTDYSSSEAETKKKKKAASKVVTINEKEKSPRKRRFGFGKKQSEPSQSPKKNQRVGIQRSPKPESDSETVFDRDENRQETDANSKRSWDTMYGAS